MPWRWSSYSTAKVLIMCKPTTLGPSVPAALLELSGTDINETVKRETGRQTDGERDGQKGVCVCQGDRREIVIIP